MSDEMLAGEPAERVLSRVPSDDGPAWGGVYQELLAKLVSREIRPGERISVDGTSRAMGVSQTPIREALSQLESEGLVTRVHLSGFRAAPLLTVEQFEALFEARLLIEPHLAGLAARRHDDEGLALMRESAERMRSISIGIEPPSYSEFASEDARLHDVIAGAAESPVLRDMMTRLHAHLHLFRLHYHERVSLDAIGEHDVILTAIGERREKASTAAMRNHLKASRQRLRVAFS